MKQIIGEAAICTLAATAFFMVVPKSLMAADMWGTMRIPVFDWTGYYAGANIGGHYGKDSATTSSDPLGWGRVRATAIDTLTPGSVSRISVEGGGQIGYNLQYNWAVFGFEADAQWLGGSASRSVSGFGNGAGTRNLFTTTMQPNWLATLRGRLGVAFSSMLLYATGGGAYSGVNFNDSFGSFGNTSIATVSSTPELWGWTVGGGLEWAIIENWIVRSEYLYVDFGSVSSSIPSCAICVAKSDIAVTHKYIESLARFGLNYKIGVKY
jgi:outer membrane immunogenic protein